MALPTDRHIDRATDRATDRACARPEGLASASTRAEASLVQAIAHWRERGADRVEPVRFRLIEAMARRAQGCEGAARAIIDDKLSALLATQVAAFEQQEAHRGDTAPAVTPTAPSPLAQLVSLLDAQHPAPATPAAKPTPARGTAGKPAELKAVKQFRSTWRRISTDQRLNKALADVPVNAGPLNSQRLIHRTLSLMREVSPEYVERFVAYVDALSWLDDVAGSGTVPKAAKGAKGR